MKDRRFATKAIRLQTPRTDFGEHSVPIYMTSSYVFDDAEAARALFAGERDGPVYSRYSNPNNDEFTEKMAALEETEEGVPFSSGMAAVFATFAALLKSGDHIVACRSVFGTTHQILTQVLPKWGISCTYVDVEHPETWAGAFRPETRLFYAETPTNPRLDLIDLGFLSDLCRPREVVSVVDNCFATPALQVPARFGIDLVIHSATKFIDGQGRALGGVVLGPKEWIEPIRLFARMTGPCLSPFNGWLFSKSLETLELRMERHSQNALEIAQTLEGHPAVQWVRYPFLPSHPQYAVAQKQMKRGGGLLAFELKEGVEAGRRFLDGLRICSLTANLGDTRSTATHPASTTHAKVSPEDRLAAGVTDGLVRLSIGLEDPEDLREDILTALATAKPGS